MSEPSIDLLQLRAAQALQELVTARLGERHFQNPAVQKLTQQARRYTIAASNLIHDAIKKEEAHGT